MRSSPTAALTLGLLAACATRDPEAARIPTALDSLITVEREFAAASVREGPRLAFLRYFDDSVVTFDPAPVIGTAALEAGADFGPLAWEPEIAEVSAAGDLGYTSGPYHAVRTDGSVAWGHYHSVWRRGPGSGWKVVLDMGSPHDEPTLLGAVERPGASIGSARQAGHPTTTELLARDRAYQAAYRQMGRHAALRAFAAERVRVCRYGLAPFRGRAVADSDQAARHEVMSWRPAGGGVAASGDLGYTYGTGEMTRDDVEGGKRAVSYSRIWRRDVMGAWRIVVEAVLPHPAD